ncbi:SDR family NAD(P)-dependent oxidoreductase [Gymnodinialimonas hymeniacidonis]|uniref:SDR family NAD(P)-dependent oxidoreductase n=1 Tax=Gymnodinialimonas hymeniacidonis TaxID=3126508 RepID=UPI0034C68C5B
MDLGLSGQRVLVTASSAGIGEAIATSFAREGATVILNGRSQATAAAAKARIEDAIDGAKVEFVVADLGSAEGCEAAIDGLPAGSVDVLVNNLGVYEPIDFFDTTDAHWQRLFEINVMSGVRLSRHFLEGMLKKKAGRIVFVSSESGINPAPEMAHYSATKTMQISVSRNLAEMTKGTDVTVNSVLPGPVNTQGVGDFIAAVFPELPREEAHAKFMRENRPTSLIERLSRPEEIADFVCFIASARASAVNGAALKVDGGMIRSVF